MVREGLCIFLIHNKRMSAEVHSIVIGKVHLSYSKILCEEYQITAKLLENVKRIVRKGQEQRRHWGAAGP